MAAPAILSGKMKFKCFKSYEALKYDYFNLLLSVVKRSPTLCAYVSLCIHACICISVYIYVYISLYIYVFISLYVCLYMFLCVYMCIYEFLCLPIEREILLLPKILLKVCSYFPLSMPEALVPFLATHN